MGRFKTYLGGMEDPQRMALARALQYGGSALSQGAGTQGFGALAEAVPAATYGYGQGMEEARAVEERRQKAEEERQESERRKVTREREDVRWERTMEEWERAETERERAAAERQAGQVAEEERRKAMLSEIESSEGPEARKRASLMSPATLEKYYVKTTGEQEPSGAPTTRSFPDGSLRQWNGESWQVLQQKPAGGGEKKSSLTPGQLRNEAQEVANREVGTWPQWQKQAQQGQVGALRGSFFPGMDAEAAPPGDLGAMREAYNREWQASFDGAMERLGGGEKTPRAPAGGAVPPQVRPETAPPSPQAAGGGRFEQLAGQVQQQLEERGASPAAREKVQAVVEAVQASVPPEVRDSEEFIQMLSKEIASGKDPSQIAREIREAFGGGR